MQSSLCKGMAVHSLCATSSWKKLSNFRNQNRSSVRFMRKFSWFSTNLWADEVEEDEGDAIGALGPTVDLCCCCKSWSIFNHCESLSLCLRINSSLRWISCLKNGTIIRTTYISLFLTSTGLEIGTFQISKPKEKSEKNRILLHKSS